MTNHDSYAYTNVRVFTGYKLRWVPRNLGGNWLVYHSSCSVYTFLHLQSNNNSSKIYYQMFLIKVIISAAQNANNYMPGGLDKRVNITKPGAVILTMYSLISEIISEI